MVGVISVLVAVVGMLQLLPMVRSNTCAVSWRFVLIVDTSFRRYHHRSMYFDFAKYSQRVMTIVGEKAQEARVSGKTVDLAVSLMLQNSGSVTAYRGFGSSRTLYEAAYGFPAFCVHNKCWRGGQYHSKLLSGLVAAEKMLERETGSAKAVKTGIIFVQDGTLEEFRQQKAEKKADEIKKKGTKIYIFLWNPGYHLMNHAESIASPGMTFSSVYFGNGNDPVADGALFNQLGRDICPAFVAATTARTSSPTKPASPAKAAPVTSATEKGSQAKATGAPKKSGVALGVGLSLLAVALIAGAAAGAFVLKKRRDSARKGSPGKSDAKPSARISGTSKRQSLSTKSVKPKSSRPPSRAQSPAPVKKSQKSASPSTKQSPKMKSVAKK